MKLFSTAIMIRKTKVFLIASLIAVNYQLPLAADRPDPITAVLECADIVAQSISCTTIGTKNIALIQYTRLANALIHSAKCGNWFIPKGRFTNTKTWYSLITDFYLASQECKKVVDAHKIAQRKLNPKLIRRIKRILLYMILIQSLLCLPYHLAPKHIWGLKTMNFLGSIISFIAKNQRYSAESEILPLLLDFEKKYLKKVKKNGSH